MNIAKDNLYKRSCPSRARSILRQPGVRMCWLLAQLSLDSALEDL